MDLQQFVNQLDYPTFNALYQAVANRRSEEAFKQQALPALDEPERVLIKGNQVLAAIKLYRVRVRELTGHTPGLRESKDLCDAILASQKGT